MTDAFFVGEVANPGDIEIVHAYFATARKVEAGFPNPNNHSSQPTLIPGSILVRLNGAGQKRIELTDVDDIEYDRMKFRMWSVDGFENGTLPQFVQSEDEAAVTRSRFEALGGLMLHPAMLHLLSADQDRNVSAPIVEDGELAVAQTLLDVSSFN